MQLRQKRPERVSAEQGKLADETGKIAVVTGKMADEPERVAGEPKKVAGKVAAMWRKVVAKPRRFAIAAAPSDKFKGLRNALHKELLLIIPKKVKNKSTYQGNERPKRNSQPMTPPSSQINLPSN